MTAHTKKPHVLIIGAGLGGLALAQALRKQEISYQIFERDTAEAARPQGWALSLHPWLINDFQISMRDDLPPLDPLNVTYNIGAPSEFAIFDNGKEIFRMGPKSEVNAEFIRANRGRLRHWLMTGVDISWGKKFVSYEENVEGVVAHFDDGSRVEGDVLVGADGIGSHVRKQLLPEALPQSLPLGTVIGEFTATQEQYERWIKIATAFYIEISGHKRTFVGVKDVAEDRRTAQYYWMYVWYDQEASKDDHWTHHASKEDLHKHVLSNLSSFSPEYAEMIRCTPDSGIFYPPLRMRDMTPVPLPKGRVTLLGDAAHPMVPFRGEGGNMAMKDGMVLASALVKEGNVQENLKTYESEMLPRTEKSVLASRANTFPKEGQMTF